MTPHATEDRRSGSPQKYAKQQRPSFMEKWEPESHAIRPLQEEEPC